MPVAKALAVRFPWQDYKTFIDIGCAQGGLPVVIAQVHSDITGGGFDLPPLKPLFENYVREHGLSQRLRFFTGDFLQDALPAVGHSAGRDCLPAGFP